MLELDRRPLPGQARPPLAESLPAGDDLPVGAVTFRPLDDRWTWSDEVFALHGFAPGEVVPTTALLLSHVEAAARPRVAALLRRGTGGCSVHGLVDARRRRRTAALVMAPARPQECVVEGWLVDLTPYASRLTSAAAAAAVTAAVEGTAVVDQATGVLASTHGLPADEAARLLDGWSAVHGLALAEAARRVVDAAVRGGADAVAALDVAAAGPATGAGYRSTR